jgi:hypothetical protein
VRITVSRPVDRRGLLWEEVLLGDDGKPLSFTAAREGINYLADRNFTIENLRELDWNIEEEADAGKN